MCTVLMTLLNHRFHTSDCTPITMRQLESLIRLTEARAKLELREEATEGDALDVVNIMRACAHPWSTPPRSPPWGAPTAAW